MVEYKLHHLQQGLHLHSSGLISDEGVCDPTFWADVAKHAAIRRRELEETQRRRRSHLSGVQRSTLEFLEAEGGSPRCHLDGRVLRGLMNRGWVESEEDRTRPVSNSQGELTGAYVLVYKVTEEGRAALKA